MLMTMLVTTKIAITVADGLAFRQMNAAIRAAHHIFNRLCRRFFFFFSGFATIDYPVNQYRYGDVEN